MSRSLIVILITILLILLSATTLAAQGRGHVGGTRGFSANPVVRPGPVVVSRPPFAVAPAHGPGFGFSPVRPVHPIRPVVVAPAFGYYPYYSPYYGPAPFYGGSAYYPYSAPSYYDQGYASPGTPQPTSNQNEIDLAYQVGQLSAQVEQLRQQQAATSYAQPSPQPQRPAQALSTPTVLVFRDGRRMEIQNYAIVGDTLWVLDGNVATKIQISDLDVDATQNENHSRGMRFLIPGK
jgi:hypothetical protein